MVNYVQNYSKHGVRPRSPGYDGYGRLNSVTSGSGAFSYGYLANSNLVQSIARPGSLTTTFSYEDHRNLITSVENKYDTITISSYGYVNDTIGRRTSMSRTGSAFSTVDALTYGYNDRSEVTSAVSNNISTYNYTFNFDSIGNRLTSNTAETGSTISTSYTSNNLNQYSSVTSAPSVVNPSYDFDGNMLNDGTWTFTWNAENQLAKAEKSDTKLEFVYDYLGRRVEKKVYSGSSSSWTLSSDLKFVYDGFKCIEVLNASNDNSVLQKFAWQPKASEQDVPLCVNDIAANTTYYYFNDANKNIGQVMDGSGSIVAKYEYSPFGKQTACSGSYANVNPFRFSSEYFDFETSLVYYNYRYYNPEFGCWISRDPINEQGGNNLYSFVANKPPNTYDFLGYGICSGSYNVSVPFSITLPLYFYSLSVNSSCSVELSLTPQNPCNESNCSNPLPHPLKCFATESHKYWPISEIYAQTGITCSDGIVDGNASYRISLYFVRAISIKDIFNLNLPDGGIMYTISGSATGKVNKCLSGCCCATKRVTCMTEMTLKENLEGKLLAVVAVASIYATAEYGAAILVAAVRAKAIALLAGA